MNRRQLLTVPLALSGSLATATGLLGLEDPPATTRRGVSLAGAEFGTQKPSFSSMDPGGFGRDYTYNGPRTIAYFCSKKILLVRIPFRWERLQPLLGEKLDPDESKRLLDTVSEVRKQGGEALLDLHNYGRYVLGHEKGRRVCIIDEEIDGKVPVSRAHFADVWKRITQLFQGQTAVSFGLMNEPHDMGRSSWREISQSAVDAIRATGDRHTLYVAGDSWSSAPRWVRANGPRPWINDPAARTIYEAHCYFDHDASGQYQRSFDRELADDPRLLQRGVDRVTPFITWCTTNKVQGMVGEFGIPATEPRWQKVLVPFLKTVDQARIESCYWAAGEWWGGYPLSIQPRRSFQEDAPQLKVLLLT